MASGQTVVQAVVVAFELAVAVPDVAAAADALHVVADPDADRCYDFVTELLMLRELHRGDPDDHLLAETAVVVLAVEADALAADSASEVVAVGSVS